MATSGAARLVRVPGLSACRARQLRGRRARGSSGDKLGGIWTLVARVLSSLAYPPAPRDLFVTKIDLHSQLTFIAINVLYEEQKRGLLWPSEVRQCPRQRGQSSEQHPDWRATGNGIPTFVR